MTEAELAVRAGVTADRVRRVVSVGIVTPNQQGLFGPGDIQRIKLAESFERSGISLEGIGESKRRPRTTSASCRWDGRR